MVADLLTIDIPSEVLGLIPKELATRLSVIPLSVDSVKVNIAVIEGSDRDVIDDVVFFHVPI